MMSIADLELDANDKDGRSFVLRIRIGTPYQLDQETWACPLVLDPLFPENRYIMGADSLQSLCLALRMANTLLSGFLMDGGNLQMDGEAFPMDAYFSPAPSVS
jgi:hypothetical protein